MLNAVLPEFQKFLVDTKIVALKHVPYYAYWANRFLDSLLLDNGLSLNIQMEKFLEQLNLLQKEQ